MKSKLLLATAVLYWGLALGSVSQAQEWGVITDDEWQAQPPPQYLDEGAVVLFDIGLAQTEESGLDFTRHTRILVYADAGIPSISNIEIEYFDYDELHNLRAQVIHPDGSYRELADDEFQTESVGSRRITRFGFYTARPDDIVEWSYRIEYSAEDETLGPDGRFLFSQKEWFTQYKKRTDGAPRIIRNEDELKQVVNLPNWFFDHDIYGMRSRFSAQIGSDIDYIYYTTNMRRRDQEPVTEAVKILFATAYEKYTWELADIPAYKPDTALAFEDEAQRIGLHFRLYAKYGRNRVLRTNYSDDHWKNVGQSMQGYKDIYCDQSKAMMKQVKKLISDAETDIDKIDAIYGYIVSGFSADSTGYVMRPVHSNMKSLYKDRTGMPFELNLLLVELLRMAGFEAWPVLISTRDKVNFRKSGIFNHMLAMVNIDEGDILMDASSNNCPLGSLPRISAAVEGVLVDYDNSRLIGFVTKVCD